MHKYVPAVSILICVASFCVCICVVVQKRRSSDGGGAEDAAAEPARRKSSRSSDDFERFDYAAAAAAAATATLRKRDGRTGKTYGADYDVCPYATFSVVQTAAVDQSSGGGGFRTPLAARRHRDPSQTDGRDDEFGSETSYHEISYISNQQTLPLASSKSSRKMMTPVHFVSPDVQDEQHQLRQCSRKMSSDTTARKHSSESRGVRRHHN